jgi:hypothetical protein
MYFRITHCLLACLCLCSGAVVADTGTVVFGSWLSREYARQAKIDIESQLGLETRIVSATVNDTAYLRVVSETLSETDARKLVATAKNQGLDAWFLAQTVNEDAPVAQATPPSRVTRAPVRTPGETRSVSSQPFEKSPRVPASSAQSVTNIAIANQPAGDAMVSVDIPYFENVDIDVDGRVGEAIWLGVPSYDNMLVSEPDTGEKPSYTTLTRFLYTKKGMYVSAVMQQPKATLVGRLSARDQYINRDAFHITLDPSGAGLYGYWFEVNLGGSVMDGQVVPERTFSEQWDGPWTGASAETDEGWSTEMFLPWSMMAMPQGDVQRTIGFWVRRKVAHLDETYSWPNLPFTGPRFMSALKPMSIPGIEPRQQAAVFPYASVTQDEISGEDEYKAGFDFSYRPSSNLQVTSTINPDFGAVESDDVVVNVTAFETFFREKRLFFLEGSETFITSPRSDINRFNPRPQGTGARATPLTFTPEPTTLLNTRRIGGAAKHIAIPDTVDISNVERNKPTDLLGAVKVVGQNGGFRYGVLAAFEDDVELLGTVAGTGEAIKIEGDGREFGVVRALYESTRVGRRSLGYIGTLVTLPDDDSMVHGIDAHSLSENGKWRYDGQYIFSDVDSVQGHGVFNDMVYVPSRNWTHRISLDYLDKRLDVDDLGFISRNDAIVARYGIVNQQTRGLKRFRSLRNSVFLSSQWSVDGFANRIGLFSNQTMTFHNRSEFKWTVNYFPEQWDDRNSRGNGMFKIEDRWFLQLAGGTDTAKRFSTSGAITAEQESLGGWSYRGDVGFTYNPSGQFSLKFDVGYKEQDGWLVYRSGRDFTTYETEDVRPSLAADFFFSARHQLRLTLQWAGIKAVDQEYYEVPLGEGPLEPRAVQPIDGSEDFTISRLTAQFRYRWEIGPLSDFFLVYTRGSNLPSQLDSEFNDLFDDALNTPIVDVFVMKIRYRFGF